MAAWGYEFYLLVLKVSLTSERNPLFGKASKGHAVFIKVPGINPKHRNTTKLVGKRSTTAREIPH